VSTPTLEEVRAAVIAEQVTSSRYVDASFEQDEDPRMSLGEYRAWQARCRELCAAKDAARLECRRLLARFVWDDDGQPTPEFLAALDAPLPSPTE